ncbi:MAG TPA: twin-arginine translocation signal domain-containing protein, partial [Candidatus Acidoferrum sp.]
MENPVHVVSKKNRRSFLKQSVLGAGAVGVGVSLLPSDLAAQNGPQKPTKGDIAILTFLSALEQVEADLWIQYAELGGATNQGLSPIDLSQNGQTI